MCRENRRLIQNDRQGQLALGLQEGVGHQEGTPLPQEGDQTIGPTAVSADTTLHNRPRRYTKYLVPRATMG